MARWVRRVAVIAVALAACSADRSGPVKGYVALPVDPAPAPPIADGPVAMRAEALARAIEQKYPLVEVWNVRAQSRGRTVVYAVRMRLDRRSEHPELEDWQAHVSEAAQSQRQAAVEMLKRTIRDLRRVRLVSVYQDEFLQPFWTRQQIRGMRSPPTYRTFERWQRLVLSAAILPGRPER